MMTSKVIEGLLLFIKNEVFSEFPIVDQFVYDETDDWGTRAIQYISRKGVFEKIEGETPNDWIIIVWNRDSITQSQTHNRAMNLTAPMLTDDKVRGKSEFRMGSIPITVNFICSGIEMAETLEEYLYVLIGETVQYKIQTEDFGELNVAAIHELGSNWEKLELQNYGSATKVSTIFTINYPIILPKVYTPGIYGISPRLGIVNNGNIQRT